ncbi:MAG TPA: iron-sulfur cluster assembly protein [Anaerolineales bacterium]|nr:iron-sulfur cluster assembly protein [Anaerolineales bacterium]HRF46026.1 iron-sulfur cluster assembly protein [Anaerolineales bacterium]
MATEADVRAELDRVMHPSFDVSLVTLRMVEAIRVSETRIEVDLVLNCPGCPASETALARARERLRRRFGEIEVSFQLLPKIWSPPWNSWL